MQDRLCRCGLAGGVCSLTWPWRCVVCLCALFRVTPMADGSRYQPSRREPDWTPGILFTSPARAPVCMFGLACRYIDSRSSGSATEASASSSADAAADHSTCVAVFTVGQVALLRAAKPPSSLTLLLQTLTAHRFLPGSTSAAAAGASQALLSSQQQAPEDGAAAAASQVTQQQPEEGGEQQPAVAGSGGAGSGSGGRLVPASVQAHGWIALGKVCLVDEGLAKKVVPLFVQVRRVGGPLQCWPLCGAWRLWFHCCVLESGGTPLSHGRPGQEGGSSCVSADGMWCCAVCCGVRRSWAGPPSPSCATTSWSRCQTCSSNTRPWWTHTCRASQAASGGAACLFHHPCRSTAVTIASCSFGAL